MFLNWADLISGSDLNSELNSRSLFLSTLSVVYRIWGHSFFGEKSQPYYYIVSNSSHLTPRLAKGIARRQTRRNTGCCNHCCCRVWHSHGILLCCSNFKSFYADNHSHSLNNTEFPDSYSDGSSHQNDHKRQRTFQYEEYFSATPTGTFSPAERN